MGYNSAVDMMIKIDIPIMISFLFETLKETNPLMIRPIVIPAKYVPIKVPAVPFDIVRTSTKYDAPQFAIPNSIAQ